MNKPKFIALMAVALFVALLVAVGAQTKPRPLAPLEEERHDPLDGLVYYPNPATGKLGLYISFELRPGHEYAIQLTDDGVTWSEPFYKKNTGTNDLYYSYNIDPCADNGALWPRIIDLGVSP